MGIALSSTGVEDYRTLHLDNADVLSPNGTGNTTMEPSCRMLLFLFFCDGSSLVIKELRVLRGLREDSMNLSS